MPVADPGQLHTTSATRNQEPFEPPPMLAFFSCGNDSACKICLFWRPGGEDDVLGGFAAAMLVHVRQSCWGRKKVPIPRAEKRRPTKGLSSLSNTRQLQSASLAEEPDVGRRLRQRLLPFARRQGEFYVYSPQWNGQATDIQVKPDKETTASKKVTVQGDSISVKWTLRQKTAATSVPSSTRRTRR